MTTFDSWAAIDQNNKPTLIGVSSGDGVTPVRVAVNPTNGRVLVDNANSSGITSINSDTTSAQILAVGTAGTDFAIVDNGTGTHTFNLPSASAANRGVVTTGNQVIGGIKFFVSGIDVGPTNQLTIDTSGNLVTSGSLGGSNFSGSSSGTNTGDQTNISGNAATVTTNANLTGVVTSVGNATSFAASPTFTGTLTVPQIVNTANAITASTGSPNTATVPVTSKNNLVTNFSAGALQITLTTSGAVSMQSCIVQILPTTAASQTLTWVNTENSATTSVPATTGSSTTIPISVGFIYNNGTSKWTCVASS